MDYSSAITGLPLPVGYLHPSFIKEISYFAPSTCCYIPPQTADLKCKSLRFEYLKARIDWLLNIYTNKCAPPFDEEKAIYVKVDSGIHAVHHNDEKSARMWNAWHSLLRSYMNEEQC